MSLSFSFFPPKLKNILLFDFGTTATATGSVVAGVVITSLSKLSSMPTLLEELDVDVALEMSSLIRMASSLLDSC
jgi:hypothetical protein